MRPQVGAVGEAQVVELLVPGQRPQDIKIPGHRDSVHMVEQTGRLGVGGAVGLLLLEVLGDLLDQGREDDVALRTAVGGRILSVPEGGGVVPGGVGDEGAGLGVVDTHAPLGGFGGLLARAVVAGDGGGGADAAGVEADDVVGLVESGRELGLVVLHHVHPGVAGAAGVDEEGALAHRAGGQVLLHRDLNGLAIRLGVVQRHLDLGALKTGPVSGLRHTTSGHAVVPLDLLTVEGLQPLGHCRLGRRSRSRPRGGHRSSRNRTGPHPQAHTRHSRQYPGGHPTTPWSDSSRTR